MDFKTHSNAGQLDQRQIYFAAFNTTDIIPMHISKLGKLLLRKIIFQPDLANVAGSYFKDVFRIFQWVQTYRVAPDKSTPDSVEVEFFFVCL